MTVQEFRARLSHFPPESIIDFATYKQLNAGDVKEMIAIEQRFDDDPETTTIIIET